MANNIFKSILKEKSKIAKDIYEYTFLGELNFLAGQFLMVDINGVKRAYSISSTPNSESQFKLIIDILPNGIGSTYFKNLKENEQVIFTGPFGKFILPDNLADRLYFISTGTGLVPLMSMIDSIVSTNNKKHKIHIVFGTQTRNKVIGYNWATNLLKQNKIDSYNIYLSRENLQEKFINNGYVTDYLKRNEILKDAQIFVCGRVVVVKSVVDILHNLGISNNNIFFENYG